MFELSRLKQKKKSYPTRKKKFKWIKSTYAHRESKVDFTDFERNHTALLSWMHLSLPKAQRFGIFSVEKKIFLFFYVNITKILFFPSFHMKWLKVCNNSLLFNSFSVFFYFIKEEHMIFYLHLIFI